MDRSPSEPAWLSEASVGPLETAALHPGGRALLRAGVEVERRTDAEHQRGREGRCAAPSTAPAWARRARTRRRAVALPPPDEQCLVVLRPVPARPSRLSRRRESDLAAGSPEPRRPLASSRTERGASPCARPRSKTAGMRSGPPMRSAPCMPTRRCNHATGAPSGNTVHAPSTAPHHRRFASGRHQHVHVAEDPVASRARERAIDHGVCATATVADGATARRARRRLAAPALPRCQAECWRTSTGIVCTISFRSPLSDQVVT